MTHAFTYAPTKGRFIVKNICTVSADGLTIAFERPDDLLLGRKQWCARFEFTANEREYWGEVYVSGEVLLMTRGANRMCRALPETHKKAWRETLACMGRLAIRQEKQERAAAMASNAAPHAIRYGAP
jgi:hypothetical protein